MFREKKMKKIFVIGTASAHTYTQRPNKIKGLAHFPGLFCPVKKFFDTPLRAESKICYNTHVFEQGREFGRVSEPWLTDWGTTKVDSTERGDNKLTT